MQKERRRKIGERRFVRSVRSASVRVEAGEEKAKL
jgi:hypothetical protein